MTSPTASASRGADFALPCAAALALAAAVAGIGLDAAGRLWVSRAAVALAVLGGAWSAFRHREALAQKLSAYFFHAEDPMNLAYTRIVVFAVIAVRFSIDYTIAFAKLPPEIVQMPVGMGWAASLIPRSAMAVGLLGLVVRVSAGAAALGLATPVSTWVAALSSCLFFVIPQMFGHVGHDRQFLVWFALLLAASPCGHRFALDGVLAGLWRRIRKKPAPPRKEPSTRYGFPRRAMLFAMGVAYFFSGFWKLAYAGVDWFRSDSLANLAAKLAWAGLAPRGGEIAAFPWLGHAAAFATICFEIGFVFALLWPLSRRIVFALAFVFHLAIRAFLGISFGHLLFCYVGLLDVSVVVDWLRRRSVPSSAEPSTPLLRPSAIAVAVVVLVLGGNTIFGALRIGDGWPFACYPRFDVLQTLRFSSYVIEGETSAGEPIRLHDAEIGGRFGKHFYNVFRANQARVGGLENADGRETRWRALCTFVWGHDPRLHDARELRFVLEDVDVAADGGRGKVLADRVQFACAPPLELAGPQPTVAPAPTEEAGESAPQGGEGTGLDAPFVAPPEATVGTFPRQLDAAITALPSPDRERAAEAVGFLMFGVSAQLAASNPAKLKQMSDRARIAQEFTRLYRFAQKQGSAMTLRKYLVLAAEMQKERPEWWAAYQKLRRGGTK
jgi:hypothetical protein